MKSDVIAFFAQSGYQVTDENITFNEKNGVKNGYAIVYLEN